MATDQLTRFVWLRQFDVGNNSRAANQLLDRLERLQKLGLPADLLADIPLHKIKCLRRHGELKWSQRTGQSAKVYPEPLKGYENGEAPEVYRPV